MGGSGGGGGGGGCSRSFAAAKAQLDRDLAPLAAELRAELRRLEARRARLAAAAAAAATAEAPAAAAGAAAAAGRDDADTAAAEEEELDCARGLMAAVDACLAADARDFQRSVAGAVGRLDERRRGCPQGPTRALLGRALFLMARCSRLLVSEPAPDAGGAPAAGAAAAPAPPPRSGGGAPGSRTAAAKAWARTRVRRRSGLAPQGERPRQLASAGGGLADELRALSLGSQGPPPPPAAAASALDALARSGRAHSFAMQPADGGGAQQPKQPPLAPGAGPRAGERQARDARPYGPRAPPHGTIFEAAQAAEDTPLSAAGAESRGRQQQQQRRQQPDAGGAAPTAVRQDSGEQQQHKSPKRSALSKALRVGAWRVGGRGQLVVPGSSAGGAGSRGSTAGSGKEHGAAAATSAQAQGAGALPRSPPRSLLQRIQRGVARAFGSDAKEAARRAAPATSGAPEQQQQQPQEQHRHQRGAADPPRELTKSPSFGLQLRDRAPSSGADGGRSGSGGGDSGGGDSGSGSAVQPLVAPGSPRAALEAVRRASLSILPSRSWLLRLGVTCAPAPPAPLQPPSWLADAPPAGGADAGAAPAPAPAAAARRARLVDGFHLARRCASETGRREYARRLAAKQALAAAAAAMRAAAAEEHQQQQHQHQLQQQQQARQKRDEAEDGGPRSLPLPPVGDKLLPPPAVSGGGANEAAAGGAAGGHDGGAQHAAMPPSPFLSAGVQMRAPSPPLPGGALDSQHHESSVSSGAAGPGLQSAWLGSYSFGPALGGASSLAAAAALRSGDSAGEEVTFPLAAPPAREGPSDRGAAGPQQDGQHEAQQDAGQQQQQQQEQQAAGMDGVGLFPSQQQQQQQPYELLDEQQQQWWWWLQHPHWSWAGGAALPYPQQHDQQQYQQPYGAQAAPHVSDAGVGQYPMAAPAAPAAQWWWPDAAAGAGLHAPGAPPGALPAAAAAYRHTVSGVDDYAAAGGGGAGAGAGMAGAVLPHALTAAGGGGGGGAWWWYPAAAAYAPGGAADAAAAAAAAAGGWWGSGGGAAPGVLPSGGGGAGGDFGYVHAAAAAAAAAARHRAVMSYSESGALPAGGPDGATLILRCHICDASFPAVLMQEHTWVSAARPRAQNAPLCRHPCRTQPPSPRPPLTHTPPPLSTNKTQQPTKQLCRICHQDLAAGAPGADARITRLASWVDDQIEHAVFPEHLHGDLARIVAAGRRAAQLQPDGTVLPAARCRAVAEELRGVMAALQADVSGRALALLEGRGAGCCSLCPHILFFIAQQAAGLNPPTMTIITTITTTTTTTATTIVVTKNRSGR